MVNYPRKQKFGKGVRRVNQQLPKVVTPVSTGGHKKVAIGKAAIKPTVTTLAIRELLVVKIGYLLGLKMNSSNAHITRDSGTL